MSLTPKSIYKDLKKKNLDYSSALDLLITLIENTDDFSTRLESIGVLEKIQAKDDKTFVLLENLLISDSNEIIRNKAASLIQYHFLDKALDPMKWALEHENAIMCLVTIILTLSKINNIKSKAIIIDKLKYFYQQENKYNLGLVFQNKEIESLSIQVLANLLINYYFIKSLKSKYGYIKYEFNELGYIIKLDLTNVDPQGISISNFLDLVHSLKYIEELDMRFNNLSELKEISVESDSLISLDLSYNKIYNLPNSICKLKSLKNLNLKSNRLRDLPDSLSSSKSIQTLNIRNNMLTHIPKAIKSFKNLKILNLHGNKLDSIDFELNNSIKELELGWNNFLEIPQKIKSLNSLERLGMSGNKLKRLPKWISLFHSLKELDLYDNKIDKLPNSIGMLSCLEILILRNNQLSQLPESIKNLKSLKKLNLSWNNFSYLPEWIGELTAIEELNLWGNRLSSLPKSIIKLSNLKTLDISFNRFEQLPQFLIEFERKVDLNIKI
ncbi:MAG: leucine-rich repeat domain-containing protein [Candidatus Hermodarchaeota archaeon]